MGAEELAYRATLDISGFTNGIKGISSSLGGIPKDLDGLVGSLGKLGLGFVAGAAGAASFGAAISQSVSKAAEYETVLNKIGKATGEGMKGLEGIQAAAHGTTFSMTEAAGAALQLGNTLKTNQQIVTALPGILNLAKQANMDLGSAVNTVTSAMKLFHQPATAAQADANLFVVAARQSKTSVGELSSALSTCGPVAAQFGNSLSTTTAALGLMISQGMQASTAGMALKGGLEALVTPSKSCAESLTALGVAVKDVDPNLHSIDEIINTLAKSGMTAGDSLEIFGNKAGPGMYALISQGSAGLEKFKSNLEGVNAATEAAKGGTETYAENMKKFGAACEEAEISLGNALLPGLTDLVGLCADATLGLIDMTGALSNWTGGVINSAIGSGSWLDNMVQGLIAFDEANYGDISDSGTATADTWTAAYEAQMQADTSEVKQQGAALGTAGGEATADAMLEAFKKANVSEGLYAGLLSGMSTEQTVAMINSQGGSGPSAKTLGSLNLGGYNFNYGSIEENEGFYKYFLDMPDGTSVPLNAANPSKDAITKLETYAKTNLTELQAAKLTNPSQAIQMELQANAKVDFTFTFDAEKKAVLLKEELQKMLDDVVSSGQITTTQADEMQKKYIEIFKLNPSTVSNINSSNMNELNMLTGSIQGWQTQLDSLISEGKAKWGDSWAGMVSITEQNLKTCKDRATQLISEMNTSIAEGTKDIVINAGKALEGQMADFGSAAGKAFEDGILTQTEKTDLMGMGPALEQMKSQFPQEFDAVGGEAALALINALKNGDWAGAAKIAADAFGKPFVDNMTIWGTKGFQALSTQNLTSLLADPEKLKSSVTDIQKFSQNTLMPEVNKLWTEASAAYKSGTWTNQAIYDSYIKPLENYAEYLPSWVLQLKTALETGNISMEGYLNANQKVYDYLDKNAAAVQNQTQQYNGLTTAINGSTAATNKLGSSNWSTYPVLALSVQPTPQQTAGPAQTIATNPYLGTNQALPVFLTNPIGQAYTATNPLPITPAASSTTGGIINHSRDTSPFYSDYYWAGDYGEPNITPPVSGFQSSGKRGIVPINQTGSPPTNPWTDQPIMSINQAAVTAQYGGKSLVMPSPGLLNPMVQPQVSANTSLASSNNQVKDSIISLTAEDGKFCEAMSEFGMKQEQSAGLFKQSSITFSDSLTPLQKELYNTSTNLVNVTADDGKFCEAISNFGMAQEDAMKKVDTSFIGTTDAYNQFKNATEDTKLHIMSVTPAVQSLGSGLGTINGNTQQLTQSNGQLGTSQQLVVNGNQLLIDSNGNLINSQLLAASVTGSISEAACEQALEQADAYGNVSLGTQAVVNDLAKLTAENGKFCEAISDFGLAQENTMGLFKQSYIGPTSTSPYGGSTNALGKVANDIQDASKEAYAINVAGSDYAYQNTVKGTDSLTNSFQQWRATADEVVYNLKNTSDSISNAGTAIKTAGEYVQTSSNNAKANWIDINSLNKSTWTGIDNTSKTSSTVAANYHGESIKTSADYWVGSIVTSGNFQTGGKSTYTAGTSPSVVNGVYQEGKVGSIKVVYPTYTNPNGIQVAGGVGPWGGTSSVTGSGGWIGTGTTAGNPAFVGGSTPTWGGAAQVTVATQGHGSIGSVTWADGGVVTKPTWGVFGEAGPEALVPLYDKAAGWKILQSILPYFTDDIEKSFLSGSIPQPIYTEFMSRINTVNEQFKNVDKQGLPDEILKLLETVDKLSSGTFFNVTGLGVTGDFDKLFTTLISLFSKPLSSDTTGTSTETGTTTSDITEKCLKSPIWTGKKYLSTGMEDPRPARDAAEAAATAATTEALSSVTSTGTTGESSGSGSLVSSSSGSLDTSQKAYTAANPLPVDASFAPQSAKVNVTNEVLAVHDKRPPVISVIINSDYVINAKDMDPQGLLALLNEHDKQFEKDIVSNIAKVWD
jgi:TP901 family phage tail tape measure protein